jgi:hypothetical protein
MPCMVSLPDGTVMILNGAHHGAAGFGLASDPNLNAILYDPSQPIGSRFAILGNTIVARLYHSEATLLPDGRVLVSGSDPQTPGFPEEYRIEVSTIHSFCLSSFSKPSPRSIFLPTLIKASHPQPSASPTPIGLMGVHTLSPI